MTPTTAPTNGLERQILWLLREARTNQRGLAEMIGCRPETVTAWKNGRCRPSRALISATAKSLHTSVAAMTDFLLHEGPEPVTNSPAPEGAVDASAVEMWGGVESWQAACRAITLILSDPGLSPAERDELRSLIINIGLLQAPHDDVQIPATVDRVFHALSRFARPSISFSWLPNTNVTHVCPTLARLLGEADPRSLINLPWIDRLAPSEKRALRDTIARFEPDAPLLVHQIRTKNGPTVVVLKLASRGVFDQSGRLVRIDSTGHEVIRDAAPLPSPEIVASGRTALAGGNGAI